MLQYLAQQFRVTVLDILHDKGTGHWGGAFSAAELLAALYFHAMNVRPEEPRWPDRDRLVVSKGHASCMLYTVLANRGFFPVGGTRHFRQLDSRLQGHPCMTSTPGVDMSTGSLGHGVSVDARHGVGWPLAGTRLLELRRCGRGRSQRGTDLGGAYGGGESSARSRLLALVDYNKVQLDGPSDEVMPMDPLADKFRAFNWNVAPQSTTATALPRFSMSLDWAQRQPGGPLAIIYRTCKGRGVSFMEDNAYWHGAAVDDVSYAKARQELLQTLEELEARLMILSQTAMRDAFGEALVDLAGKHPEMVVLDADVSSCTRTAVFGKHIPTGSSTSAWPKPTWWTSPQAWRPAGCGRWSAPSPSSSA